MQIIYKEKQQKKLVFGDVKDDQFFVDNCNYLCQKYGEQSYNIIANQFGVPRSGRTLEVSCNTIVTRILPEVEKIEF
jgi:hypothetical protein